MRYTYEDIISQMKNAYELAAGSNISCGSDEEKQLEALATELFSLSSYGDFILKQAFVQTATGEYLDRHGRLRDCIRQGGTKASGLLTFSVTAPAQNDVHISEGTVCSVEGQPLLQFITTKGATLEAGQTSVTVCAEAVAYGRKFNAPPNSISVMVNAPVGIEAVTNENAFSGGYDGESDNAYRSRIINCYKLPSVFTSKREAENRLREIDGIIDCVLEKTDSPDKIGLIVRAATGSYEQLPIKAQNEVLDSIGINTFTNTLVDIKDATEKCVNATVSVRLSYGADEQQTRQLVESIVTEHFSGERIGESVSVSALLRELFRLDYVEQIDFNCDNMVNDVVYCAHDNYLHLESLRVICYE